MKAILQPKVLGAVAGAVALATAMNANAVPSFARQTGLACMACHTVFPELTPFGRTFKLNGYTLTGIQQIEQKAGVGTGGVKINSIPPLSAMLQVGMTHVSKTPAGTQNNNVEFPQQLSFFFAGEVTPHIGSFLQFTIAQADGGGFALDNSDIRYANHTTVGGSPLAYGIDVNNTPTVADLWNSTPAWGFPFASQDSYDTPAASVLIGSDALNQNVAGLGAYAMWDNHLYGDVTLYRSAHFGSATPVNGSATYKKPNGTVSPYGDASANTIKNIAPYWRLAYQTNFGQNYLMVGTYGMYAQMYPGANAGTPGISGPTDDYTDTAIDTQYERPFGGNMVSVHASYMHEKQNLHASAPGEGTTNLNEFKVNGIYHWGNEAEVALAYDNLSGSKNATVQQNVYGNSNDSPDSTAYIAQVSYLPWENTKFSLQYTAYGKFNGTSDNASDNNTLYLLGWLMW